MRGRSATLTTAPFACLQQVRHLGRGHELLDLARGHRPGHVWRTTSVGLLSTGPQKASRCAPGAERLPRMPPRSSNGRATAVRASSLCKASRNQTRPAASIDSCLQSHAHDCSRNTAEHYRKPCRLLFALTRQHGFVIVADPLAGPAEHGKDTSTRPCLSRPGAQGLLLGVLTRGFSWASWPWAWSRRGLPTRSRV